MTIFIQIYFHKKENNNKTYHKMTVFYTFDGFGFNNDLSRTKTASNITIHTIYTTTGFKYFPRFRPQLKGWRFCDSSWLDVVFFDTINYQIHNTNSTWMYVYRASNVIGYQQYILGTWNTKLFPNISKT